ncbi:hypothetical protein P886_0768 [Alteromonadaceae bacterium 2753L.S.0a.02]|nr:hypothetical protein P886_0768 [Alteromonadaceae bacterium 2753L.S.0a.02]
MLKRRNVVAEGVASGRIKAIRCLYWDDTKDTKSRINNAKKIFKTKADFAAEKIDIKAHPGNAEAPPHSSKVPALSIENINVVDHLKKCVLKS